MRGRITPKYLCRAITVAILVSWLYLVVLAAVTASALTAAKSLGSQRSTETVKKTFKILALSMAISLLSLAVFAWIK